jgi:flagellar hook-associated protein 2
MGASAPISLPNFANINFNTIITSIIAAAEVPIGALNQQVQGEQAAISALGTVQGDLSSLQSALDPFQNYNSSPPMTASAQSEAPFSASVTGSATPGSYSVTVNQLAAAQALASQGYSSASDTVGTGTITLTVGGVQNQITINSSNDTLSGVASAINSANVGVTAQVINTGLPSDPYRLELISNQTGTANAFQVSTSLTGGTAPNFATSSVGPVDYSGITGTANSSTNGPLVSGTYSATDTQGFTFTVTQGGTVGSSAITIAWQNGTGGSGTITVPSNYSAGSLISVADGLQLSFNATGGTLNTNDTFSVAAFNPVVQSAQNAQVVVGNQVISSGTNTISDAIPGVTLSLTGTGGPYSLQVAEDTSTEANQIQTFVKAYNQLLSDINTNTVAVPGQNTPPLNANGPLESLLFGLNSALGTINLSQLGITIDGNAVTNNNGQLEFSQSAFDAAVQSNPTGVQNAMNQLYGVLNGLVSDALTPNTGVIASETNSYQNQVQSQEQQISSMQQQVQQEQTNLENQYSLLQAQIEQYSSIMSMLEAESGISNPISSSSSGSSSSSSSSSSLSSLLG